jgi:hypothetical protein
MTGFPSLVRSTTASGEVRYRFGDPLVDRYLEFAADRARPNTLRALAFDLKTFLAVVGEDPREVTSADVFGFLVQQRGDRTVVRLSDRESGLFGAHDRSAAVISVGSMPTQLRVATRGEPESGAARSVDSPRGWHA